MVPDAFNPPSDLFFITEVNFELSAPLGRSGARHGELRVRIRDGGRLRRRL